MKELAGAIIVVAVVVGVAFASYQGSAYFDPKYEALRTKTFKESQAYNDSMAQDIEAAHIEWLKGDASVKAAVRAQVLHRVSAYDTTRLSRELQDWIKEIK